MGGLTAAQVLTPRGRNLATGRQPGRPAWPNAVLDRAPRTFRFVNLILKFCPAGHRLMWRGGEAASRIRCRMPSSAPASGSGQRSLGAASCPRWARARAPGRTL